MSSVSTGTTSLRLAQSTTTDATLAPKESPPVKAMKNRIREIKNSRQISNKSHPPVNTRDKIARAIIYEFSNNILQNISNNCRVNSEGEDRNFCTLIQGAARKSKCKGDMPYDLTRMIGGFYDGRVRVNSENILPEDHEKLKKTIKVFFESVDKELRLVLYFLI